jgi:DNA-binding transcriptional LysR family regulator
LPKYVKIIINLDNNMSKLERIQTFITVIDEGSFIGAAKKLNTAPATITRQVHALEQELGVQLIERTTRRLKLTEIGQHYFEEAKKLIDQLISTENLIAQSHSEPTGRLKVNVTRFTAIRYILPHLKEFMQQYPKINLTLDLAERFPDMDKEEVDLVFALAIEGSPDVVRRKVFGAKMLFCASPEYLQQYGVPQKPDDLKQHRFISHTMRKPPDVLNFRNHPPIRVNPILGVNDSLAMQRCALNGIGFVMIFDFFAQQYLESGELVEILKDYSEDDKPLYLYYKQNKYLDPKIRAFIDFFMDKVPKSPDPCQH